LAASWPPWPGAGLLVDGGEQGVDADGLALLGDDLGEHAGGGGGHLDGHLVGLELAEHLVLGDRLALLLEPGGDGGLGHALAERGHADLDHSLPSDRQRFVDERVLLLLVLAGEAGRRRGRGRAPDVARPAVLGPMRPSTHSRFGSTKVQAPWFFGSSWHQTISACLKRPSSLVSAERRERVELLEPHQVDVVDAAGVALLEQVVVDLARAHHDAADLVVGRSFALEMP
jgi:hypothetical protein